MVAQPDPFHVAPPNVVRPPPIVERRHTFRRASDRLAHEERLLLARALDILAGDGPAEEQLAELLGLVASVAGARRAAVVADGEDRRVAVAVGRHEDGEAARALARWLDANAPRSLIERAASGPAPVALVRARTATAGAPLPRAGPGRAPAAVALPPGPAFALAPVPGVERVHIGLELATPVDAEELAARFPGALARHAAVALALVTSPVAADAELERLRAREVERARFVSTVAHELRTPLTGLGGYLDLDGQVRDEAVVREFLERGRTIVGSMGELVGDLLQLARLESGALRLATVPFPVAEACGPGIASSDREKVFAPFVRLDGHERVAGTGLGLAIARDLARAMAGDLDAASVVGSGSSFVLVLPAVPSQGRATAAALSRALEAEEQELEERAVLQAIRGSGHRRTRDGPGAERGAA